MGACTALLVGVHGAWVLPGIPPLHETYGWDEVAGRARALRETLPPDSFYLAAGGRHYAPASQLAFHLEAPFQVYGANLIGQEALQYRYWANPDEFAGKDAVVAVVGEDPFKKVRTALRQYFDSVEQVDHLIVPVERFQFLRKPLLEARLYRAYGYHPVPREMSND
jgi:hypothetical protein